MFRGGALIGALCLLTSGRAVAQWDTHWNESGPHPSTCIFNSVESYPGDEVCVRPHASQACGLDGTLGPVEAAPDCSSGQAAERSMTEDKGRGDTACTFRERKFSLGAEVCSGPGIKLVCGGNGVFGRPTAEANCPAALSTVP